MMIFLLVISMVLFLLVLVVLFTPVRLVIDSSSGVYRLSVGRFSSIGLLFENGKMLMEIRFLFWRRIIDPFESESETGPEIRTVDIKNLERSGTVKRKTISLSKVIAILKSFKVNRFRIMINTGNMPLNGILYPVLYWFSRKLGKEVGIVFYGQSEVNINIENNLARITWAYIKTK